MEPPRRTKRPAGDDGAVVDAPHYEVHDDDAASDFLDDGNEYSDDDLDGVSSRGNIGFLDESGSFVERAARGRGSTKDDLWLGATDADVDAPVATKRARKALERQEEDERILEGVVGSRAVFDIKKRIAGILQPGETVPRALRRLKGADKDKRGGGYGVMMDEAARRAFDELMDAAAELVRRGDLDAYTDDREAFERGAWDYEHARRRRRMAAAVPGAQPQEEEDQQTAAVTRDCYVDMFENDAVDAGLKTENV